MNTEERAEKTAGRYRKNSEDKAQPFPLKLHQHYIDRLQYLPGKNNAEKIRNLIDSSINWYERERRQVKEIKRLISPLYREARDLMKPEKKADAVEYSKNCQRFFDHLKTLETMLEIMHYDFSSLKGHLDQRDLVELEIIFATKQSLSV